MEERTALGRSSLEYGQREGPGSSHYPWNRSRVNTRRSAIGHCADLRQETERGWDRAARSGTGKKETKKKKGGGHLGENSCSLVEVGIKSDAKLRGRTAAQFEEETPGSARGGRRSPDIQSDVLV